MGWLSNNLVTSKQDTTKPGESAETGGEDTKKTPDMVATPFTPVVVEVQRAELLGTARILASWPWQLARAIFWILLGAAIGIVCAVLLRLLIPMFLTSDPEPEHLHVATSNLTTPRACALEALTRAHSQRPCHFVLLSAHPAQSVHLVYKLRDNYPNLKTRYHPNPDDFFEDSPLDGFFKFGGSSSLLELAARTMALWRNGGVSVDLDRPVFNLPPSGKYVQQDQGALMQFPQPCHPALQGLIAALGSDLSASADEAMKRATSWMCRVEKDAKNAPKPEQCLGVNVLGGDKNKKKDIFCPVVRAHFEDLFKDDPFKNFFD